MSSEQGDRVEGLAAEALLDLASRAVAALAARTLSGAVCDEALVASVTRLQRLERMVAAEKLRRAAEVQTRGAAGAAGARSAADLLAGLGLTRGEARSQVAAGQALARLPQTAARAAAGQLGVGQAQVAARALEELTRDGPADPAAVAELDTLVAGAGAATDRRELGRSVDRWAHQRGGDTLADRERAAHARRHLYTTRTGDGLGLLEGRLTPILYAKLTALLDTHDRPTSPDDPRSAGQRRHDALETLCDRALGATDGGGAGQAGAAGGAAGARVLLIVDHDTLHDHPGAPPADLDGWGPVSSATARMLCCDAEVTAIRIRMADGTVLNAGRVRRDPTPLQRDAVTARDRRCVGCGAPTRRCHIHHIRPWEHGGPTDIANLCLLCPACHTNVHHFGWHLTRTPTGHYHAGPAPPDQQPHGHPHAA